jgi:hypothetical protein
MAMGDGALKFLNPSRLGTGWGFSLQRPRTGRGKRSRAVIASQLF